MSASSLSGLSFGPVVSKPVLSRSLTSLGVRRASELTVTGSASGRVFPVLPELAAMLPARGLVGGTTVLVRGSRSLLLALLAAATGSGSWAALVGMPEIGVPAAAELGVVLRRLALVPYPAGQASAVISALLDGMDLVAVSTGVLTGALTGAAGRTPALARRLSARARHCGAVLLAFGDRWPAADIELACEGATWFGLGHGYGYLNGRRVVLSLTGRGAAARGRRQILLLPGPGGAVAGTTEHHHPPGETEAVAG